jgi:hypothetical protein
LTFSREGRKMEFRQLMRALRREGFRFERTASGHWKVFAKERETGFARRSENPRARKTALADLKRIGYDWPRGGTR